LKKVLIVGANSAIAEALARQFAEQGDSVILAGRSEEKLDILSADLIVRGAAECKSLLFDALDLNSHESLAAQAWEMLGGLDVAVIAHGTLSDQAQCEASFSDAQREYEINFLSAVSLLTPFANAFEKQKSGSIAVISSVAGDRGRQSNYIYGSAKAGLSAYLQGLRNRLNKSGVQVLTVKPGFVDTPMTAHIEPKGALWAQPEAVAKSIYKAIGGNRNVLYTPAIWQVIMLVIKSIPEFLFKRLSL
jgi:short-subunit dehydrogenase